MKKFKVIPEINEKFEKANRKEKFEIMKRNFFELNEKNKYLGILELECHYYYYNKEIMDKNELIYNISEYRYNKYNLLDRLDNIPYLYIDKKLSKEDYNFLCELYKIYSFRNPMKYFIFLISNKIKSENISYNLILKFFKDPKYKKLIFEYMELLSEKQKKELINCAINNKQVVSLRKFCLIHNKDIYKKIRKMGH